MKLMFNLFTVMPVDKPFDPEHVSKIGMTITGARGYSVRLLTHESNHDQRSFTLCFVRQADERVLYQAVYTRANSGVTKAPALEFLRQIFLIEYWYCPKNRELVPVYDAPVHGMKRQNWSDVMLDCNTMGHWLNSNSPLFDEGERKTLAFVDKIGNYVEGPLLQSVRWSTEELHLNLGQKTPSAEITVRDISDRKLTDIHHRRNLTDTFPVGGPFKRTEKVIQQQFKFNVVENDHTYALECLREIDTDENPFYIELDANVVSLKLLGCKTNPHDLF
jgi:hypothetical protein